MSDRVQLLNAVKQVLTGNEPIEEIRRITSMAAVQRGIDVTIEEIDAFFDPREPTCASATTAKPSARQLSGPPPSLLVDWGPQDNLSAGAQALALFEIACSPELESRRAPRVALYIDEHLDQNADTTKPFVEKQEAGLWRFSVPIALTSNGEPCRPGQYLIRVTAAFPEASTEVRYFVCRIRIKVGQQNQVQERTLEIDGADHSVVNLHGHDLRHFSHVVLKGDGSSIVNLQNNLYAAETNGKPDESLKQAFEMRPDFTLIDALPALMAGAEDGPSRLDRATLNLPGGRRVLMIADTDISLGRSKKNNDVVLRFMPTGQKGELNYERSKFISQHHLQICLTKNGCEVIDGTKAADDGVGHNSTWGTSVDGLALAGSTHLTAGSSRSSIAVTLASKAKQSLPLELQMRLINGNIDPMTSGSQSGQEGRFTRELVEMMYADVVGVQERPATWLTSAQNGLNAVALIRLNNLAEEGYLIVGHSAIIGRRGDCAIVLDDPSVAAQHARLIPIGDGFWIESLVDEGTRCAGGPLPLQYLAPLRVGMTIGIGNLEIAFGPFEQQHL